MASLMIDDFNVRYHVSLTSGNNLDVQSDPSIIGGKRQTYLTILGSVYTQEPGVTLDIRNGRLILDTGARVHRGLQVGYGYDYTLPWRYFPLNLNLQPYNLFRISFLFSEGMRPDDFSMQVSSAAGPPPRLPSGATFQAGVSSLPVDVGPDGFDLDLRFNRFVRNEPPSGEPGNLEDCIRDKRNIPIDTILLLFAGTPIGASNFAIKSIKCINV